MNLNNVAAFAPSPIKVGLITTGTFIALLQARGKKTLTEQNMENLHRAEELFKDIVTLSRLDEGKAHQLGEMAGMPLGLLWLKWPVEKVVARLHTPETPRDHGTHFLEHLSAKFSSVVRKIEQGTPVMDGETDLLERFWSGLSNEMLGTANKERLKEGDGDSD